MIKSCRVGCNPPLSLFRSALLCLVAALPAAGQNLPDGYEIIHLMDEPADYSKRPTINNCGQIVFETRMNQGLGEIFLYDNGHLVQITNDNVHDALPDIGADGTIVWSRGIGPDGGFEVAMYRDGEMSILTDSPGSKSSPHINDVGHVSWNKFTEEPCGASEIFLFNGKTIEPITDNGFSNQGEMLNDEDVVVWAQKDFCSQPWDYRVMRYTDGVIEELSNGESFAQAPVIDNSGWIVWQFEIAFDELALNQLVDGQVTLLLDWGSNPETNDEGDMYFLRWHESNSTWQGWLCLGCGPNASGEPTIFQLTDDPFWNTNGEINDYSEVVWMAKGFPIADIYFLRRVRNGDADLDGDVDLDDAGTLEGCMTEPVPTDRLCDCRFLDLDHDRDVDMHDFAVFQRNYTGAR